MANHDFELVPGLLTTRVQIAAALGGSRFGGIEPAADSEMVIVYSDLQAAKKHGYVFDGQTEDDDRGPRYLYTGEGPSGDQTFIAGNKSLLRHREEGRTLQLFVADGYVVNPATGKTTGTKQQRYVGQMMIDPDEPFERRRALGADGRERWVIVFHLRPDPQAEYPPKFTAAEATQPAPLDALVDLDFEIEPETAPTTGEAPAVVEPWSEQIETEAHITGETVANIPGGQRTVLRREGQLVSEYKAHLVAAGHVVKRYQISVEGVSTTLKTDLYDATENALYEAKGTVRRDDVRMAIGQLFDYRRHLDVPDGMRLAVLLPGDPGKDLRALLDDVGISLVIRTPEGFDGFPLAPRITDTPQDPEGVGRRRSGLGPLAP
ncbi:hypothetical protein [Kitasatospora purpeofusca]|uniref:hypothetical protein n=1 Tax=Kitasatospora purpeofusca TaxID=67352 RepID=UPI003651E1BB